jgi:GNAT superfamily N-acetyltransferase
LARRAVRADLPRLVELLADDVLGRELGRDRRVDPADAPRYAAAFEQIDHDDNQRLLVAEVDGRIVAMLQLTFIPGLSRRGAWRANIESVRVAGELRGRGIGRWLIAHALELARARGCRLAQLTSDKRRTEAHRFYGRLGFSATHDGFKRELEPA